MTSASAFSVPDQTGRTVIVTGANSGLGFETSRRLAAAGAHVVLACRNLDRGREAAARIEGSTEVRQLDTASLASVRAFADGLDRPDRRAREQRRDHGGRRGPQRRRIRAAARHELPRRVRADRPAAAAAHRSGGDALEPGAPHRADRARRPELAAALLLAVARLRAVEAGRPDVRLRPAAPLHRGRIPAARGGGASRRGKHRPHAWAAHAALGRRRVGCSRQRARPVGGGRRTADALRRDRRRPAGRLLHRAERPRRGAGRTGDRRIHQGVRTTATSSGC